MVFLMDKLWPAPSPIIEHHSGAEQGGIVPPNPTPAGDTFAAHVSVEVPQQKNQVPSQVLSCTPPRDASEVGTLYCCSANRHQKEDCPRQEGAGM